MILPDWFREQIENITVGREVTINTEYGDYELYMHLWFDITTETSHDNPPESTVMLDKADCITAGIYDEDGDLIFDLRTECEEYAREFWHKQVI